MDESAWDAMARVGTVARAHGNRGAVVVNPETDFPESRFRPGAVLWLRREGGVAPVTIEAARFQRGRPILGLSGVRTIDEAEALAGRELRVPLADLTALAPGAFYRHDLVGCHVRCRDGDPVGTVLRVEGDRASSRLVVDAGGREVLVPLAAGICVRIDPGAREIEIDPPEGLLDLNR